MERDILLEAFTEKWRWEQAIEKAVRKGISKKSCRDAQEENVRKAIILAIYNDTYCISPPHMQEIPKDDGGKRIVYINEDMDRIILIIINDILFEFFGKEMISNNCTSYQKGIGYGSTVRDSITKIQRNRNQFDFKADLSKYFDSVAIEYIDKVFDEVEEIAGKSKIINLLRRYYHQNLCFDTNGNLIEHYQSLKQGCAVAAFLADTVLKELDDKMSKLKGVYIRYSDDILFCGRDAVRAKKTLEEHLAGMQMKLNPKKVEQLCKNKWFKFLGFNLKREMITLSPKRVHTFQQEIYDRIKYCYTANMAIKAIRKYLYAGSDGHSWATNVLAIINCEKDIATMDEFLLDCIRVCAINKKGKMIKKNDIGGLGFDKNGDDWSIVRSKGKKCFMARQLTDDKFDNYYSLACMRKALLAGRNVYEARLLWKPYKVKTEDVPVASQEEIIETLEKLYQEYKTSVPNDFTYNSQSYFKAKDLDELTTEEMCINPYREEVKRKLERYLFSNIAKGNLKWDDAWGSWYHCMNDRDFVLLKEWFK